MSNPSKKAPELTKFLEETFGRTTAITTNRCAFCKGPADTFRDSLSEKEYRISGLCQPCQDATFGGGK